MKSKELKQYLKEDEDRIIKVLEHFEFHDFWRAGEEIRCASPTGTNSTAISIRLDEDDLFASSYDSMVNYHGDILGLIQEYNDSGFGEIMGEIHRLFNLSNSYKKQVQKVDILADIRNLKAREKRRADTENEKHDKDVLNRFIKRNHVSMLEEAISPSVLKQFDIMFDPVKSRIIFPHYDWLEHDKVVGIKGRTTMSSELAREFDVPKYWNYIKGYKKTGNLYGFDKAYKNVIDSKMLIIFESEKSVLKQFTIEKGKGFSVATGGHDELSESQLRFIIQNTPSDTEIVFAFDKDIMVGDEKIDGKEYLESVCKKVSGFRRTSYIYDKFKILEDKDSPIDRGVKRWNHLLKWRVKVS